MSNEEIKTDQYFNFLSYQVPIKNECNFKIT